MLKKILIRQGHYQTFTGNDCYEMMGGALIGQWS